MALLTQVIILDRGWPDVYYRKLGYSMCSVQIVEVCVGEGRLAHTA
jgi:hypothetical protein